MKTKPFFLAGCVLLLFIFAGTPASAETKIEEALRELDAQWSKAAESKNVDRTVSYYADSAVVMPPNAPKATTKEAIRTLWKNLLTSPGSAISWKTTKVEVAPSGDIGYSSGTYELTMNDASGRLIADRGKYVAVWKKVAWGTWKCVMDIWNSDTPAAAPSEKK